MLEPAQSSNARSILRALHATHESIRGCALVTGDGRILASFLGSGIDHDRFGAMCATLIALASRVVEEAAQGEFQQLIVGGSDGPIMLTQAGKGRVLAIFATPKCLLGRMIRDSTAAALELMKL